MRRVMATKNWHERNRLWQEAISQQGRWNEEIIEKYIELLRGDGDA